MDIEIKKVGEKLRTVRKALDLKQEDLVKYKINVGAKDTPFTRNLVSMVETDKSPLTKKLAETIHKNILMACKEKGIPFDHDFKEVCMTPEDQIYRYIDNYNKTICDFISADESIIYGEKLITLAESYNLQPALSTLYRLLGERCKKHNLDLASKYYLKATVLKSELSDSEHIELTNKLKVIYIKLGKYNDALELKYTHGSNIRDFIIKCAFNDILCLKKLERYDEALSEISNLNQILLKEDKEFLIRTKMITANIFIIKEDFYSARRIYKNLLSQSKTNENSLLIKNNLLNLKVLTGTCTLSNLIEFSNIDLSSDVLPEKIVLFYKTLADGYEEFDMNKSISYLKKAIDFVLSQSVLSAETKNYFNLLLESLLANEEKMQLFIEKSPDDFKMLIASGLNKNLLDNDLVFKILLYFQTREDYKFVNRLLKSRVS